MAYDPSAENLRLLRRFATAIFDLGGRSQRTELLYYIFLITLIQVVALVVNLTFFEGTLGRGLGIYELAVWIPVIPWFIRRLHDQDRTGWLAVVLPLLLAQNTYEEVLYKSGQLPIPELGYPYNALKLMLVIAFWVLAFWPGSSGDNRFGSNPRLGS